MKRRDFITRATTELDAAGADTLWTALQEQGVEVTPSNVLNTALLIGIPPEKAENLARAVSAEQQSAEPEAEPTPEPKVEAEPEAEPTLRPKPTNGRRTRKSEEK